MVHLIKRKKYDGDGHLHRMQRGACGQLFVMRKRGVTHTFEGRSQQLRLVDCPGCKQVIFEQETRPWCCYGCGGSMAESGLLHLRPDDVNTYCDQCHAERVERFQIGQERDPDRSGSP